ncbi:MAG: protein-L-isoaspartate O-methyltransferase [Candidatus Aenigmarchaeota archaeon]|nr:protein-L-isoaspartate O-methyltransferase [Candidatus Aenigmarchaeota archaeon]
MAGKPDTEFAEKRKRLVDALAEERVVRSDAVRKAMLKVPREDFVPAEHRKAAYDDTPLPIPAEATISAPHMHAMYLEAAGLKPGQDVLEVGFGSGILLAYAKELVGAKGSVTGVEISPDVYIFGKRNLERAGYDKKVRLMSGDVTNGALAKEKFDRIFVSATAPEVPKPLTPMLKTGGILIAPVGDAYGNQELVLVMKDKAGKLLMKSLGPVAFVPLRGQYGSRG